MSDIETSSDDDFEVVQRPRQTKQSFEVEEGAFPAFGGPAQAAASTSMDFSSAWASTKAPTAMPQPIARRRPAAQAQTASNEPEPSSEGPSIPWRSSDWDHKMANVPQWSGPAPRKFAEPADPYAQVSAGKPHPVQARAPVAPKSQTRSEEAPKPKKEKKEPASLVVDGDGFMEVASRKSRPDQAVSKQSTVKVVETSSSFGALMMDEQANTPKKETPKENGKKPNGKLAAKAAAMKKVETKTGGDGFDEKMYKTAWDNSGADAKKVAETLGLTSVPKDYDEYLSFCKAGKFKD